MPLRSVIRPYQPADRDAVYDVCVRTAYNGGDSRDLYPDLELMPSIFVGPYTVLEPDLAFVVDDGDRAAGYIVGAADTADFFRRYRSDWLPTLADHFPLPTTPPATPSEEMIDLMHHPERMFPPEAAGYPAHLHICLLPGHQRSGYGRELMETLGKALTSRGVSAVHLGMVTANTPARAFYDRLGFHEIPATGAETVTYLGRSTTFKL